MCPDGTSVQEDSFCEHPAIVIHSAFYAIQWILHANTGPGKRNRNLRFFFFRMFPSSYWGGLFPVYSLIFIYNFQVYSCTVIHFYAEVKRCLFSVDTLHGKMHQLFLLWIYSSVDSNHLWLRRVCVCTCKFWVLITVQFRQNITITAINFKHLSGLRVSWQYQLSVYVLCLALLHTVTGNRGAGILQLSRPTTLVSEKSCCSRWEIVVFQK